MITLLPRRRSLYIKVLILIPSSWFLVTLLISLNETSVRHPNHHESVAVDDTDVFNGHLNPVEEVKGVLPSHDLLPPSAQLLQRQNEDAGEPDSLLPSKVIPSWKRRRNSKLSLRQDTHASGSHDDFLHDTDSRGEKKREDGQVKRPKEESNPENALNPDEELYVQSDQHRAQNQDQDLEDKMIRHKYQGILRRQQQQDLKREETASLDHLHHLRRNVSQRHDALLPSHKVISFFGHLL